MEASCSGLSWMHDMCRCHGNEWWLIRLFDEVRMGGGRWCCYSDEFVWCLGRPHGSLRTLAWEPVIFVGEDAASHPGWILVHLAQLIGYGLTSLWKFLWGLQYCTPNFGRSGVCSTLLIEWNLTYCLGSAIISGCSIASYSRGCVKCKHEYLIDWSSPHVGLVKKWSQHNPSPCMNVFESPGLRVTLLVMISHCLWNGSGWPHV